MVAVNIIAADTTPTAEYLATTQFQSFLNAIRNTPQRIQPPVDSMDGLWSPEEEFMVMSRLGGSIIGDKAKVESELRAFIDATNADEIMVSAIIYDQQARLRSYDLVAEIAMKTARAAS